MKNENIPIVISKLFKELEIPATSGGINDQLKRHSDGESMLAISDLLTRFEVPNAAYQVAFEELAAVPVPFITYLKNDRFVIVNSLNDKQVIISNEVKNKQPLPIEEFKKIFTGKILAVEKDENSGEPDYEFKRRKEIIEQFRVPFVVTGATIIFSIILWINQSGSGVFTWHYGFLLIFTIGGLTASILLLLQSINANNPLIQKLCGSDSNKNCNAILSSKAAKVTAELSWSEVGFFYFAGTFLALIFAGNQGNVIQALAVLNIVSLPYTFFSIYYQWRIAKQWCIFCCTVQAVLWLEFFAYLPYLSGGIHLPGIYESGRVFICFLLPVLLWGFLKPYLLYSKELKLLKPELYRFKYNKDLFQNMLQNELRYNLLPEEDTIIIGNREADKVITLVSNPFCIHCSKTHKILDDLLELREDIKLQLVFVGRTLEREIDKKVMGHFLSLELAQNPVKLREAINDWYKQDEKNYELWKEKYPSVESAVEPPIILKQKEWCSMVDITSTPTLFINGYRLPEVYQANDIAYIL